jgi:hypothetical protein
VDLALKTEFDGQLPQWFPLRAVAKDEEAGGHAAASGTIAGIARRAGHRGHLLRRVGNRQRCRE